MIELKNLKDLEQLFKLCRKQGITEIDLSSMTFKLGDLPLTADQQAEQDKNNQALTGFPEGELTPEQLMFYSSGGLPENDPALKDKAN